MTAFEYKVVPSPVRGEKAPGVKTPEARFALAIEKVMNQMAGEGWEYHRAESLPSEERSGFARTVTLWRNVLVFRRARGTDLSRRDPKLPSAASETGPVSRAPVGPAPRSAGLGVAGMRLAPLTAGADMAGPSLSADARADHPEKASASENDTPLTSAPRLSGGTPEARATAPQHGAFASPAEPPLDAGASDESSELGSESRARAARTVPPSQET